MTVPLPENPRTPIEAMIREGDLEGLLKKAGELHGHFCPYVALGVRAGYTALKALGIERNVGMEEVIAIVEVNNCFSDGIQMTTGCSFANNAMIYHDVGKTAVTVARRDNSGAVATEAVRVAVRADYSASFDERYPEAHKLFEKIVRNREEPTPEERKRLSQLWAETSYRQLDLPEEEIFTVERKQIDLPSYAPILDSVICSVCGESVMETKARLRGGEPVCIPCAGAERYVLDGSGISVA
ncbi:MAG: FmdE family protein [Chloroflexota bacterium]|nr:FmdE family protein [Chloroflexota bacterium]